MKTTALDLNSALGHQALRERLGARDVETVEMPVRITLTSVTPTYDERRHYEYGLRMSGFVSGIDVLGNLGEGVDYVEMAGGHGPEVDVEVKFDDAQHATLANAGLFRPDFNDEPDQLMALIREAGGVEVTLTQKVDALVVPPLSEEDAPLVFVSVHTTDPMVMTRENSGIDLTEYYTPAPSLTAELEDSAPEIGLSEPSSQPTVEREGALNHEFLDLFASRNADAPLEDETHEQSEQSENEHDESVVAPGPEDIDEETPADELDRLRAEVDDLLTSVRSEALENEPLEDDQTDAPEVDQAGMLVMPSDEELGIQRTDVAPEPEHEEHEEPRRGRHAADPTPIETRNDSEGVKVMSFEDDGLGA